MHYSDSAGDDATQARGADAFGPGLGPGDSLDSAAESLAHLLAGRECVSPRVRALAGEVAALVDTPVTGDLCAGAVLADDVAVLARATQVLSVEIARRAHAARVRDVTVTGVKSTLVRAGWTPTDASRALRVGAMLERHPVLTGMVRAGCVTRDDVLAIARATRTLTAEQADQVVAWLASWAPALDSAGIAVAAQAAADHLRPTDADSREQDAHDDRYLVFTRFAGTISFEGRLPALEGEAFARAVAAFAEKQRADGDGLSGAQRAADGLTTLVADATSRGLVPTRGGAPGCVSVVIPLKDADRVAAGRRRCRLPLPDPHTMTPTRPGRRPHADDGVQGGVIAGSHTLGDAAARFLLCCADMTGAIVAGSPVGAMLASTPLEPLALGRARRLATTAQRRALALRDRGCVIPGCTVTADACQAHHVTDWATGGHTDLDNLALLCWTHHRQVDLRRWKLTRTHGAGPHWTATRTPRSSWRPRP